MLIRRTISSTLARGAPLARSLPSTSRFHHTTPVLLSSISQRSPLRSFPPISPFLIPRRTYASSPSADDVMETLTDLYGTARDEFEIAHEETSKKSVYAEDDRAAAHEALKDLKEEYERVLSQGSPEVAKEVQGRVGQRIRELESAVTAMEEMAMED